LLSPPKFEKEKENETKKNSTERELLRMSEVNVDRDILKIEFDFKDENTDESIKYWVSLKKWDKQ